MDLLRTAFLVAALVHSSAGYKFFQERLPNGDFVPHPCKPNYVWKGVGHENILGGGVRNPFGRDFADNGFKWDSCLCNQDSDGDGRTNGEELGDPDCIWTPGEAPKHKFGLSHPGVCEPLDDPACVETNTFEIDCTPPEPFTCEGIDNLDVIAVTIRFPPTTVPAQETTYMCQTFELPDSQEYHLIAYEPIINNENVMHHTIVFGCDDDKEIMSSPDLCDMSMSGCEEDMIALWAVGASGYCFPTNVGFRIGVNGVKKVNLQHHWTNPTEKEDYIDSSGMILYLTPLLREKDAAIMHTGQYYLQIPPAQKKVVFNSTCSSECTGGLSETIYITDISIHMHYQGESGYAEHWRNGVKIRDLVIQEDFDYDSPLVVSFDPPVEFQPGDEIRSQCAFNSWNQDSITFWGESSYDEMCLIFFLYYPAHPDMNYCGMYKEHNICSEVKVDWNMACNPRAFEKDTGVQLAFFALSASCDPKGATCFDGCQEKIDQLRSHSCLEGQTGLYVERGMLLRGETFETLVRQLHSCDTYDNIVTDKDRDVEDNMTEGDRYDPETNNIPQEGVCPWQTGDSNALHFNVVLIFVTAIVYHFLSK